jgi:hypothetical protein
MQIIFCDLLRIVLRPKFELSNNDLKITQIVKFSNAQCCVHLLPTSTQYNLGIFLTYFIK